LPINANDVGLAIIALIPVYMILFAIMGAIAGGVIGLIIYNIIKIIKKKKK